MIQGIKLDLIFPHKITSHKKILPKSWLVHECINQLLTETPAIIYKSITSTTKNFIIEDTKLKIQDHQIYRKVIKKIAGSYLVDNDPRLFQLERTVEDFLKIMT